MGQVRSDSGNAFVRWFRSWQELKPWYRWGPPSGRFKLTVEPVFVPAQVGESSDYRALGIGVGEFDWNSDVPPEGLGFHDWESATDGTSFRWTSRIWANQPVGIEGSEAAFRVLANHPDLATSPVRVEIFWNERLLQTIEARDGSWLTIALSVTDLGREPGMLSFHVDLMWSPADDGVSLDTRRLGVAVSEIEWR